MKYCIMLQGDICGGDRGTGTRENKGGRWAVSGRRWGGINLASQGLQTRHGGTCKDPG